MQNILNPNISLEKELTIMRKQSIMLLLAASAITPVCGKVTLPNYVTDNMIVQQSSCLTVNGQATPDSKVKVSAGWEKKSTTVKADSQGNFTVKIKTPKAGGPYTIAFEDPDGVKQIENVLSGEVWLCSGQSNMEFPVQGWGTLMGYDLEVATAHHPDIRLLQVKKKTSIAPQKDVEVNGGGWQICTSASMANFSAIAYLFAKEMSEKLNLPIGVIDTTWGGTPAEAWTSAEALGGVAGFESELADLKAADYDFDKLNAIYQKKINDWMALANAGAPEFDKGELQTGEAWKEIQLPGLWENSVLPNFDGIVWLQRTIDVPADKVGKSINLRFAAIDDEDETYFNGELIAKGSGYNVARNYTVPGRLVKAGENVITIKVTDFGGEGGMAPGITEAIIDNENISLAGTWQYSIHSDFGGLPAKPEAPQGSNYPTVLYNAMLSPLKDMPVKGVLWYQGCANVGRDQQYETLFKTMIGDWRKLWGDDLSFYFVQLAGFLQPRAVQPNSDWAALRNAQSKALELDNTAMATAVDLGNPADIHPKNKQDVAHRLALIALNRNYGFDCVYEGPRCVSSERSGKEVVLKFNSPIKATSVAVTGFIIAGEDGKFTTATPTIVDEYTLKLSSPLVAKPTIVRYNWADYPAGNLYGETGLPVAPFATDK